ncbi:hypothetical protein [Glycomyces dulcitolivorans]|uniref:hypothetical protein n=1 Tax=Glycomyces dulcitolivorans TaxID=2200759 RepID=UPI000DD382D7|nr:hypothetical protein [Glycomyces dulcitolivorans]
MSEYDDTELLKRRADDIRVGDQVFTPAHRWEAVDGVLRVGELRYVEITTRQGRKEYRWRFQPWHTHPVLPASYTAREPKARLWDGGRGLKNVIAAVWDWEYSAHKGYHLAAAYGKTGAGWEVYDYGIGTPATLVGEGLSKAQAVSLVKRIARERAKELGVAVDFGGAQ